MYACAENLESPAYDYWMDAGSHIVAQWQAETQASIAQNQAEAEELKHKLRAAAEKKAHELKALLEKKQAAEAAKNSLAATTTKFDGLRIDEVRDDEAKGAARQPSPPLRTPSPLQPPGPKSASPSPPPSPAVGRKGEPEFKETPEMTESSSQQKSQDKGEEKLEEATAAPNPELANLRRPCNTCYELPLQYNVGYEVMERDCYVRGSDICRQAGDGKSPKDPVWSSSSAAIEYDD